MRNVLITARVQIRKPQQCEWYIRCRDCSRATYHTRRSISSSTLLRRQLPEQQDEVAAKDSKQDDTEDRGAERWKSLMRTLNKPVAIVTARTQDTEDSRSGLVAATISSFVSVSVQPDINISFNLTNRSSTYDALCDSQYFCLTFPQATSRGAKLAEHLARNSTKPGHSSFDDGTQLELISMPSPLTLDDSAAEIPKFMPCAVAAAELSQHHASGLAFAVTCRYLNSIEVGDHVIIAGTVLLDSFVNGLPHGWGADHVHGDDSSPEHVTLGHVHGRFTNIDGLVQQTDEDGDSNGNGKAQGQSDAGVT